MAAIVQPAHVKSDNVFSAYVRQTYVAFKGLMKIIRMMKGAPLSGAVQIQLDHPARTVTLNPADIKEMIKSVEDGILFLGVIHRYVITTKRSRQGPGAGLVNPRIAAAKVIDFLNTALEGVMIPGTGYQLKDAIHATTDGMVNMSMLTTLFIIYQKMAGIPKQGRYILIEQINPGTGRPYAELLTTTFADEFAEASRHVRPGKGYDNFLGAGARKFSFANFQTIVHSLVTAFPSKWEQYSVLPVDVQGYITRIFQDLLDKAAAAVRAGNATAVQIAANPTSVGMLGADNYASRFDLAKEAVMNDLHLITSVNSSL
jgi:hypothetical protein